ncbi:hypothetical protein HYW44_02630 [Candidatus Daviesbacteria bacterium]|nr:hypothetical protein [Candidatus Daviesbacteria bacterium]
MAIALREIESVETDERAVTDFKLVKKGPFREGGFLVGRLISERRGENRAEEVAAIARELATYEAILPDAFNRSRRLNITRLIAQTHPVLRY